VYVMCTVEKKDDLFPGQRPSSRVLIPVYTASALASQKSLFARPSLCEATFTRQWLIDGLGSDSHVPAKVVFHASSEGSFYTAFSHWHAGVRPVSTDPKTQMEDVKLRRYLSAEHGKKTRVRDGYELYGRISGEGDDVGGFFQKSK
jgi:hypothetical protein